MRTSNSTILGFAATSVGLLAGCMASPQLPLVRDAAGLAQPRSLEAISWMGKSIQKRDLLYVSNTNGTVSVYRYWQRTLVGVLTNFAQPLGECADRYSNVYIVDFSTKHISVYAHGGTKPIRVIDDSPYSPYGCAVDYRTGKLAVANYGPSYYKVGNVAVYQPGTNKRIVYEGGTTDRFTDCAYDDRGDLLTTAQYGFSSYYYSDFYYLPKHGTKLIPMDLPPPSSFWQWASIYGLAWDGQYWLVNFRLALPLYDRHQGSIRGYDRSEPRWATSHRRLSPDTHIARRASRYHSRLSQ